ncbi:hypothetical protein F5X68DRAFT_188556 [Plectosphaerella plurivora]|uniref:Uncharacterized protein n=1 Tax=Plectosphaerella plurivora TaxID=936078 RepID=A0A9P8VHX0_9PEZI|nr:hypothetical protein F5X68DRAFT_188556 [Plectosphaerella plurivora]
MPWKNRFPMMRSGNAGDINPVSDQHDETSTVFGGKSLESGLKHGREKTPSGEKSAKHFEKVEYSDDVVVEKLSKRLRLKRHCGRRWKWYLLGTIIFLTIMLPVFFLEIFPAIAQLMINSSDLPIRSGIIRALDAETIEFSATVGLSVPAGFTVTLEPTTLFFFNRNTQPYSPWIDVSLGEQRVSGDSDLTVDRYVASISDQDEFGKFLDQLFASDETIVSGRADTRVRLGALKADITLDKDIVVGGARRLEGFGFDKLNIVLPPEADGTNICGALNLPNHSDIRLQLGNVSFNVMAGDLVIGRVETWNTDIHPGNNSVDFFGEVYLQTMLQNVGEVIRSQAAALAEGMLQLATTGNETRVDGVRIPYVERVLKPRIESRAPLLKLLGDLLSGLLELPVFEDAGGLLEDILGGLGGNGTEEEGGGGGFEDLLENLLGRRSLGVTRLLAVGRGVFRREAPTMVKRLEGLKGGNMFKDVLGSRGTGLGHVVAVGREVLRREGMSIASSLYKG